MAAMLGELDLMVEFTMRQFKLTRKKSGGIIIPGAPQATEQISLLELYVQQREQFAATLTEERNAFARAQAIAAGQQPNGHDTASVNGKKLDFEPEGGHES